MKTIKILLNKIKILLIFLLLFFQTTIIIGQSCPPCLLEKDAKDEAQANLSIAINNVNSAQGGVDTWENNVAVAFAAIATAGAGATAACSGPGAVTPVCWTALAAVAAAEAYCAYCLYNYNNAIKAMNDALDAKDLAQNNFNLAKQAYLDCMARPKDPCKKCENGTVVDKCGPNERCCEGGICKNIKECCSECSADQQCCNGVCVPKEYECIVTTVVIDCNGSTTSSVINSCSGSYSPPPCETTGKLEYSQGVCTGGSMVTVCYSGPFLKPCN